jgi:hypothetical protein
MLEKIPRNHFTRSTLYQVSTANALVEGIYEDAVRVGTLRKHGDLGLGTFENLDEMNISFRYGVKEPHHDILGYTVNVAVKMTNLAKHNGLVIGQSVYDVLDEKQRSTFKILNLSPDVWNYTDGKSGSIYLVYGSRES